MIDAQEQQAAARVRAALRQVGFGEAEISARLGPRWTQPPQPQQRAAWMQRMGTDDLATTVSLLLLAEPHEPDEVVAAGLPLDDLLTSGLCFLDDRGRVVAAARLAPWFDLVVASDRPDQLGSPEFVLGPSLSGERCADLSVRRRVATALDVGTGCGLQALLAARHAEHVVATDVNERAFWFAERNAALNGVTNVEWRVGSWLEPVAGERFDLVVCNAPFVVTANPGPLYRDGGMAGDAVSELLVRNLPSVLSDDAWATVLVGWFARPDEPLQRPLEWLEESGCGAMILTDRIFSLFDHAEAWAPVPADLDERRAAHTAWVDGLRTFGFEQIREGAVVLRSGARPWRVSEAVSAEARNPAGTHLERLAAAAELLLDHPGSFLDEPLRVAGSVRLDGTRTLAAGDDEAGMVEVRVLDGLGVVATVDPITAQALRLLDDVPTARTAIRRAALTEGAATNRLPELEADADHVVTELVRLGVLEPRPEPEAAEVPLVPGALARAGEVLRSLGYDEARVRDLLRQPGPRPIEPADREVVLRRLDADDPVHVLALLFLLEAGVEGDGVEDTLGQEAIEALLAAGLLVRTEEGYEATVHLVPYGDLLLASDQAAGHDGPDRVPGAHLATWMTDRLTVRRPVGRALDLGTGCGTLGLLAARHAEEVVSTDVNRRALAYAAANAELNGITNITFREGPWYEPVAGEQFDLVVSNPPFVISPESRYLYRDGGTTDVVSRLVLGGVAEHLADGGDATILVAWEQPLDDLRPAPAAWLEGQPLDAWLLVRGVDDVLTHAKAWNRPLRDDLVAYTERVDAWERALTDAGVQRIGNGAVVARKVEGVGAVRTTPLDLDRLGEAGPQLDRMLDAAGLLDALGDDPMALLPLVCVVAADVRVTQVLQPTDDGFRPVKADLHVDDGLGLELGLDPQALQLVDALREPAPLGAVVQQLAAHLELPVDAVAPAALGLARILLQLGVLAALGILASPDDDDEDDGADG